MPELPEVETTRRGIAPHLIQQKVAQVVIRNAKLRWPIPAHLDTQLQKQVIKAINRRGKYLLLEFSKGTLIIHLGMSGSLRILSQPIAPDKHDHVDLILTNGSYLRFTDPRRFGCFLWTSENPALHSLLKKLGPEPLTSSFNGQYLFQISRQRRTPIKTFIMNAQIVTGVGNIYANEALFLAGIHPQRAVKTISQPEYQKLAQAIKMILRAAIRQGGTTLRNFVTSEGKPGYFKQRLQVYGRANLPCNKCGRILKEIRLGQRSTVFCPNCQQL